MTDDRQTQTTERWEYRFLTMSHNEGENITSLNAAGSVGWELCHVGRLQYILKRRVS